MSSPGPSRIPVSARRRSSLQRPVPLRIALAVLALGALLPSLILFAREYRYVGAEKKAEIERQGRLFARAIADDITREIAVKETQLAVLGTSNHLNTDDLAAFHAQALQARSKVPGWIVVLSADGQQILNTTRPFGSPLPRSRAQSTIDEAIASGSCRSSDLFQSHLSDQMVVALICPVPQKPLLLAGTMPIEHLDTVVQRQTPEGWVATLIDRAGTIVASSRGTTAVGAPSSAEIRARIATRPDGWSTVPIEGEPYYAGWQRLDNGWTVIAAVPRALVEAPMNRWKTDVLWSLVVFAGLATLCSALVGEWIIRSMNTLSRAAATIGAGGVIDKVESSIREVDEVGTALAQASHDRAKGEIANAHLAALVSSSGDAIFSVSLDGEILSWNTAAEELYGYRAEEAVCRPHSMLVPPARQGEIDHKVAAVREGGNLRLETVRIRKDGVPVEVSLDAAPIRAPDGTVVGISVIAHDISRRKRNEAHMEFIMRELSHRTKNLITVIIAMARRTARQTEAFADFETKFTGRLHGLARSHDVLVHRDWRGAPLEDLVRLHLAPFVAEAASLHVEGPHLLLRPEAVQNLGFALHELATNANKYGALGQAGGEVAIRWSLETGAAGEPRVKLTWRETGGPRVEVPSRTGFGSTVIQKLTEASLNAVVTMSYDPDGFRWEVDIPAHEILSEIDPGPTAGPLAGAPDASAGPTAGTLERQDAAAQ